MTRLTCTLDPHAGLITTAEAAPVQWQGDGLHLAACGQVPDPEGLARALAEHGPAALSSLGGAFALAFADSNRATAFAAVDRFGCLALAARHDGAVVHLDSRAEALAGDAAPDAQALFHYFFFHMVPGPGSAFAGVQRVEPGCVLLQEADRLVSQRWHEPRFATGWAAPSGAAADLDDAITGGVQRCVGAGEPVAAFLSGGLDSSTVVDVAARHAEVTAFTMGFDVDGYDEVAFAEAAARHSGVPLEAYYVTPEDVVDALPVLAREFDQPFGNSSALPAWCCARLARERGFDHILAGDGGDELFAGNERYRTQLLFAAWGQVPANVQQRVRDVVDPGIDGGPWPLRKLRAYIRQADVAMPERLHTWNFLRRSPLADLFTGTFLAQVDDTRPSSLLADTWHGVDGNIVDRMLVMDWKFTLADNDLRKVRHACNAADIEVSFPLLDAAVADVAERVPAAAKLRAMRLRHFYRVAMHRRLSRATRTKSKHGFGMPFGHWLRDHAPLRELADDAVERFATRGVLREDYLATLRSGLLDEHAGYYGEMLWLVVMLELWLQARPHLADFSAA